MPTPQSNSLSPLSSSSESPPPDLPVFQYQAFSTAVRFLFPNNDTVTLPARSGCSVRDAILPLCEARQLPIQALEIFQSESKEVSSSVWFCEMLVVDNN